MTDHIESGKGGNVERGRSRFFRPSLCPAFTLLELLATLAVIAALTGAAGLMPTLLSLKSPGNPRTEAQHLGRWLTDAMTISNRTGRAFRLFCPGNSPQPASVIVIEWENPVERKAYTPIGDCRFIRWQDSTPTSVYTPQWNTLSPALSIKVVNDRAEEYYTIVSVYGRVRTNRLPPPRGQE
ncbi:MAG: prepilin-type N-terminal cleavage/methylation domain-containing protein [Synergistaceae bacterium]|jgi:prepilin-type N-terminal cleavage/methylation domain-containing protein|nr:prepilin-type N-terminal cleavage/methylation domain-containing protein [Synergistaceae bacterium]